MISCSHPNIDWYTILNVGWCGLSGSEANIKYLFIYSWILLLNQIFCVNLAWLSISVMTTYTQYNTLDLLLHILSLSPSRFLVRISKQGTLLMLKWRCRDFARIYKEEPNLSMVWLVPLKQRTKSATIWLASQKNKASINELKLFLCFYFLFCRQTCGINADSFLRKEKKGESKFQLLYLCPCRRLSILGFS